MKKLIDDLKEYLHYDPQTGDFTWIKDVGYKIKAGTTAGYVLNTGYKCLTFRKKTYLVSRLAYFYMTGTWPIEIDHINENKADNRWENLRNVNRSQNVFGVKKKRKHPLPIGVYKNNNRYSASVTFDHKSHYLGTFESINKAVNARKDFLEVVNPHGYLKKD